MGASPRRKKVRLSDNASFRAISMGGSSVKNEQESSGAGSVRRERNVSSTSRAMGESRRDSELASNKTNLGQIAPLT